MAGLATVFGSGAMTNSIGEISGADAIFIIGSNTTETHPVIGYRVREAVRNGAKLIVADPRDIDLARDAAVHLQQKPGTDVALLNGMLNVIINEGLTDSSFIDKRTEGFDRMKEAVARYTPEYAAEITGVPAVLIREAALAYASAGKATILYTMGITQHTSGTDNVLCIANLAMATGNVGKSSTGVNPLRGQNNVQGACDMGALPVVYTAYQKVGDPAVQDKFSGAWDVKLNDKPGLTVTEIFDGAINGNIKALYVMGENPAISDANTNHVIEALEKAEFLVVQDIFLTETAQYADVVLPAACFAEKDGTFVNTERRVQLSRRAVVSPGEALPDWMILTELANSLGLNWSYNSAGDVFKEIASLSPSYAGITYERLENGGLQWPCPDAEHPGTPFLHGEQFPRGQGLFSAVDYRPPAEEVDGEYPFILTTGRHLYHYHTGTMTRRSAGLEQSRPEEQIQISMEDAAEHGIEEGDTIEISSRRGTVKAKADITSTVPPGVIFMTFHYAEANANLLTNSALDPVSKTPEFKVCAVKITKS